MADTPKTLIFDVNETLLDLAPLKNSVGAALDGRGDLLPLWFTTMLHYSLVDSITGNYREFADVGVGALMMIGEKQGIDIDRDAAEAAIVGPITNLPAYPDVKPALIRLSAAGFEIVSLTNSSNAGVNAQLTNAGIVDLFDRVISTEDVQAFKPDPRPYRHALELVDAEPAQVLMVAAHAWDLAGADAQGLQTAFVRRPGATLYPNVDKPGYDVTDLTQLVTALTTTSGD